MLTQIEMAQSIYDNDGACGHANGWGPCSGCPVQPVCSGGPSVYRLCFDAAKMFLNDYKPPTSYLSTKTRRKPAFKRLSSRKTYRPEESAWDKSVKEADDFWDFHGSDVRL